MRTYDHTFIEWVVKSGDPGRKAVAALGKLGYDIIVLPRRVYLFGLGEVYTLPPLPDPGDPKLAFAMRLRDCIVALDLEEDNALSDTVL